MKNGYSKTNDNATQAAAKQLIGKINCSETAKDPAHAVIIMSFGETGAVVSNKVDKEKMTPSMMAKINQLAQQAEIVLVLEKIKELAHGCVHKAPKKTIRKVTVKA